MGKFIVEFVPRAARQVAEIDDWWRANRDKAPDAFHEDLTELLASLEHMPRAVGASVNQRPGIRRALLRRVRYGVYFRVENDSRVLILAVWHTSRGGLPEL